MDGKLVSGSLSAMERGERENARSSFSTYTDKFYELFPYYLSIGMTYDQYWNDDVDLVKYYREAEEIRNDKKNQELWLQGMYIYEALCDVSPVLHAFAKKGVKPQPYSSNPYPITQKQIKREKEEKERKIAEKGKAFMQRAMASINNNFKGTPHNE